MTAKREIGLIVNPIAGMGGKVGLKGTDGDGTVVQALRLGARPLAGERAARALARLVPDGVTIAAARGAMGGDCARAAGLAVSELTIPAGEDTSADDTRLAAKALMAQGVDLMLFAGGDGTARDIFDIVGSNVPMLGIPTGVKMHSGVFATSPAAAGQVAGLFSAGDASVRFREAEVMDIDETALRDGRIAGRLYGYARVPYERGLVQNCKAGASLSDEEALDALSRRIVTEMEPGRLYVIGCGTTTRRVKRVLGFEGTLLGIDVVLDRRPIATDVSEERLLRLAAGQPATVIVSVTGGQGYLFGRGNQQISAEVLKAVGLDNVMVMTGTSKLLSLDPPCLRVDTGDEAVDRALAGYRPVHTAPGQTMMMRVAA